MSIDSGTVLTRKKAYSIKRVHGALRNWGKPAAVDVASHAIGPKSTAISTTEATAGAAPIQGAEKAKQVFLTAGSAHNCRLRRRLGGEMDIVGGRER